MADEEWERLVKVIRGEWELAEDVPIDGETKLAELFGRMDGSLSGAGYDSLEALELVMAIEEEFGVDIPDEVLEPATGPESTVGELYGVLRRAIDA